MKKGMASVLLPVRSAWFAKARRVVALMTDRARDHEKSLEKEGGSNLPPHRQECKCERVLSGVRTLGRSRDARP